MTTKDKNMKTLDINQWMEKIKKMEKGEKLDLSSDQDLSIGIMNLISIEEHLFFTYEKTGKESYLDLLNEVREIRKGLLKKIIKVYEGEVWCISKHLLAASMRLMEVGTKALTKGDKKQAKEMFDKSFHLYNLFWGINLKMIEVDDVKRHDIDVNFIDEEKKPKLQKKVNLLAQVGEVVKKALDCCRE
jgi:hypothetical protein